MPHTPASFPRAACFLAALLFASAWLLGAPRAAADFAASPPGGPRYDASAILVQLKPGIRFAPGSIRTGSPALDDHLARAAARDAARLFPTPRAGRSLHASLGMDRVYRIGLRRAADVPVLAAEIARDPGVEWAEPDYEGSAADVAPVFPNDPYFDHQWALRNTGFVPGIGTSTPGADVRATEAWTVTTGDSSVVVAVLDSGIRYDDPAFAGRLWTNPGEIPDNGVDDDGNGYVDDVRGYNFAYANAEVRDDLGHGNAVAGVIGVTSDDGAGYCGLDWACRIMPVKILTGAGNGSYSWWASAIQYAVDNGARILNMSVVGGSQSVALQTAVRYASARGCLIVAAMGNSGEPTRYVPASYDEVLAVGATDRNDRRAGFSTYGNALDVVAPGVDIAVLTLGMETYAGYGSGTSFASPMAAGLAALLLAKNPSLGATDLRNVIGATAEDGVGRDAQDAPGWDPYYGYGRIDCYRALTLERVPHPPVVSAPAFSTPVEGLTTTIVVSASDPDGDPIQRLVADRSVFPAEDDVSFAVNATNTSGTFTWTPTYEDAGGPYNVAFRAYDPLRGEAVTTMYVANVNRLPRVTAPELVALEETVTGGFDVAGSDPDGEELALEATGLPFGAVFEDRGDNTGAFVWTPGMGQAGSYAVSFTARDGWNGGTGSASTRLEVRRRNRAPLAQAGGPYAGVAGAPVAFDGSGSADPDGDPLRFRWGFGDGADGFGSVASHVYEGGGAYPVTLEVSDGVLTGGDSTSAWIANALPARAFLAEGHRTVSMSAGSAPVCICVEPVASSYANADLDLGSLALEREVAGSTLRATPDPRAVTEGDRDRNGVADLSLCFGRADLRRLFGDVAGRDSVRAALEGRLTTGARVLAPLSLAVTGGGPIGVGVSSNPLSAGGRITLRTSREGLLRVRLFDARGRLVRALADERIAAAGFHELALRGGLSSGIYFLRAETPDGVVTARIAILR